LVSATKAQGRCGDSAKTDKHRRDGLAFRESDQRVRSAEVFAEVNAHLSETVYQVRIVSAGYRVCGSACKEKLMEEADLEEIASALDDTLLLTGGFAWPYQLPRSQLLELLDFVRVHCPRARRFGGICSGSMLLAEAGLLHGRQATTHWSCLEQMTARYSDVDVLSDRIYVQDGNCYTAAGGTSAIDLALALVEEDWGTDVALDIAKCMVLFLRRSGAQPQLSTTLLAQTSQVGSISNLLVWMAGNLNQDLSVSKLARRVAMSPRNFARHFLHEVGKTPGRHVTDLRLEAARRNLGQGELSLSEVAKASGFGSVEVFRRLFTKSFGIPPGRYRIQLNTASETANREYDQSLVSSISSN
jgi:transcriptional regulator GlxA family with amidase domain